MTTLNDSGEKIREMTAAIIADGQNDYLEHYGVAGMKWGVRSAETLRKYGLLTGAKARAAARAAAAKLRKSKAQAEAQAKRVGQAAKAKASRVASNAVKGAQARAHKAVSDVKNEHAAKQAEKAAAKEQAKIQKALAQAQRKELGMSKREFDRLRETTLKSHDPGVVAKGMRTLTDAELKAKLTRLQDESRIANMDSANKKARAEMWKTRFEALQKSPIQSLVIDPVSKVTSNIIQDQLYGAGLKPLINQRVTWHKNNAEDAYASSHPGAHQSDDSKKQKAAINERNEQLAAEQAARKEAARSKLINLGSKITSSSINSDQQRAAAERGKARMMNERVAETQRAHDNFDRIRAEGQWRTATGTNRGTAAPSGTPSRSYNSPNQMPFRHKEPSPVAGKRDAAHESARNTTTSDTQRTRRPERYANNAASSAPGIFEANVVSASSRQSSRARRATESSGVYSQPVGNTEKQQERGALVLRRMR